MKRSKLLPELLDRLLYTGCYNSKQVSVVLSPHLLGKCYDNGDVGLLPWVM